MACPLPFRPWLSPDPRVFSFEAPRRLRILTVGRLLSCTSTPPQRLSSHAPLPYSRLMPTMSRSREAPRYVHSALQHVRIRGTPFFTFFRRRPAGFTFPTGGPAPRVWLPFQRPQVPQPLETSFSPQRSWASLFRAFLRCGDQEPVSRPFLRPRAFPQNRSALYRRLGGFIPPHQPCPLSLPEFLARVGA